MKPTGGQPYRATFLFVAIPIAAAIALAWIVIDRASVRTHLEMAERNRALQVELARNAMEEGFERLLQENRVLAAYSFPEYARGLRGRASMEALLEAEGDAYPESLSYCYLTGPGRLELAWARPGAEETMEALVFASVAQWDGFLGMSDPVVLSSRSNRPEPYFMALFPVRVGGDMVGILATAIGLGRSIDTYLSPLAEGEGRRSFLMFGAGRVLWASDDRNPSLFELDQGSLMTSRSFALGDGEFTIIADESRASLLSELEAIDRPRFLVGAMGLLTMVAALFFANRLYLERRGRQALASEERRLSARVAAGERELRALLDDRELLLRELHHRVKNNFQYLDSLIELQKGGASADVAAALSNIQARIAALAAAYLINADRPESLRVDARDYLTALAGKVVDGAGVELVIEAEDIPVSLDSAVPLGLLFHELLTNAVRHGYAGKRGYAGGHGDRVAVRFYRDGETAVLEVRDFGTGLEAGTADGLGLTIVRALVAQLNGGFSLENREPGVIAEARFPLA